MNGEDHVNMPEVVLEEGTSLEQEQIDCLNTIILNNLPTAKEPGIRTRVFAIKLYTLIENLLFEPRLHLVEEPEEVFDLTQQGWMDGNYEKLLRHPWFFGRRLKEKVKNNDLQTTKRTIKDRTDAEELERMSKKAIDAFSDILQDYAKGSLDYHFSSRHDRKRPHANVYHPDADRVHLVLSGLGDPNETLTGWKDVFHCPKEEDMRQSFSTTVIDLPGYGKTRLLFEAVAEYFLIYFTRSQEKVTWASGSGDAQWAVETVDPTLKSTFGGDAAERAFYVLIYVRMYVLANFLDLVLSHNVTPFDARRRLLLLQACPPCLANSEDIFVHIAKVAQSFDEETLCRASGQSSNKFCDSIKEVLHGTNDSPRLCLTFDEAHKATRDPWLSHRYSLLPRMLEMVDSCLQPKAIVCAASQLSVNMLNVGSLSPGSRLSYASNTRRLQSDSLEEYILRHLRAVLPGLLERIKKWLYPRPRLVARLIEMYLAAAQNGVKKIPYHRILSSAFEVSTGYRPVDAMDLEAQEEAVPEFIIGQSFGCGVSKRKSFSGHIDSTFMEMVSRLLCRWMLSNPSALKLGSYKSAKLLELGVTTLPSLNPQSPAYFMLNVRYDVSLTEAYGAVSLLSLLGSPDTAIFKDCIKEAITFDAGMPTQKDKFERSMVWTLINCLGTEDGSVLDDIFDFHRDAPSWTKQPYRLISFARGNNVPVRLTWKSGASLRLVIRAREPNDIEHWLRNPKGIPFMFKDGCHCLAFVENRTTLEQSVLIVHDTMEGDYEMEKQIADLKKGLQHQRVVYSGVNKFKGIGKGQVDSFVL
ncbi:hypothetical protein ARMGADRAFT_1159519 [Armillaria gallica]|uniref:Uncharacterized protein n=1 Tax=Armillaria gallica TaxID=47427 RepID=A0A2H3DY52_ARMGA|nr:hypothetical protein ARMGADRAFT_1159519 [Armillaria gallica]